jgi:hypothetical protein
VKKFLFQVVFFGILVLIPVIFVFFIADGTTDPYYMRFTSPRQKNLIIGTSRAAQGIVPSVLDSLLKNRHHLDGGSFFNYAFTLTHSPYGPTYLKSIQGKLDTHAGAGIFILTVDPWSISSEAGDPENLNDFKESRLFLERTRFVNMFPNLCYLVNSYDKAFINIIKNRVQKLHRFESAETLYLHDNGWLEVNIAMDSAAVRKRTLAKIESYRSEFLPLYKNSNLRYQYLKQTIQYLKQFGRVFLVRLPVDIGILQVENEFMPQFDKKIKELSLDTKTPYLDMTKGPDATTFEFTDGNHLYRNSSRDVTRKIGNWIISVSGN